jgi:hypothetical protein
MRHEIDEEDESAQLEKMANEKSTCLERQSEQERIKTYG